jgi:hypothetical protein
MPTSEVRPYQPSTVADTFERISAETDAWLAIGDFLDDWRRTVSVEQRQKLVDTPISTPNSDPHLHRWAAFCAAMVEQLCLEAGLAVPEWVFRPAYVLSEPWYLYRSRRPKWRAWQEAASPEPFKKRHIYGGDRIRARA